MKKAVLFTALSVITFGVAGSEAFACSSGFIANALCQAGILTKSQANEADAANAALNHPVEQLAVIGAATINPTLGMAVGAGMQMNQAGQMMNNPGTLPNVYPVNQQFQQFQQVQTLQMPTQQVGNTCVASNGWWMKGPFNPVGMPCNFFANGMQVFGSVQ